MPNYPHLHTPYGGGDGQRHPRSPLATWTTGGGLVFDELLAYFSIITIERFNTVWPTFRPSNGLLFD